MTNDFYEQNLYRIGYDVGMGLKKFREPNMFSYYLNKKSFYEGYLEGVKERKDI